MSFEIRFNPKSDSEDISFEPEKVVVPPVKPPPPEKPKVQPSVNAHHSFKERIASKYEETSHAVKARMAARAASLDVQEHPTPASIGSFPPKSISSITKSISQHAVLAPLERLRTSSVTATSTISSLTCSQPSPNLETTPQMTVPAATSERPAPPLPSSVQMKTFSPPEEAVEITEDDDFVPAPEDSPEEPPGDASWEVVTDERHVILPQFPPSPPVFISGEESRSQANMNNSFTSDEPPPRADSFNDTWYDFLIFWYRVIVVTIVSLIYYSGLLPDLIMGGLVAVVAVHLLPGLMFSEKRQQEKPKARAPGEHINYPISIYVPESETYIYTTWMTISRSYNPDVFSHKDAKQIYSKLEGFTLTYFAPNAQEMKKLKRMKHMPAYYVTNAEREEVLDMRQWTVHLRPKNLASKRQFNRKYPIGLRPRHVADDTHSEINMKTDENGDLYQTPMTRGLLDEAESHSQTLYFFCTNGPEKEIWYHLLKAASEGLSLQPFSKVRVPEIPSRKTSSQSENMQLQMSDLLDKDDSDFEFEMSQIPDRDRDETDTPETSPEYSYKSKYSKHYIAKRTDFKRRIIPRLVNKDLCSGSDRCTSSIDCHYEMLWVNALMTRLLFDVATEPVWKAVIMDKLQSKLSKIRLPAVIEPLELKDVSPGTDLPVLSKVAKPDVNDQGLWVSFACHYHGGFQAVIATRLNLTKLKQDGAKMAPKVARDPALYQSKQTQLQNEEEDSSSSSSDDEDEAASSIQAKETATKLLDRIHKSKYIQKMLDTGFVHRTMEKVSNTSLELQVSLVTVKGTLWINIPPPPSDRLWYGFDEDLEVTIVAKPKVGTREISQSRIVEYIQKKLVSEFRKKLVRPSMDDITIPVMCSGVKLC